MEKEKKELYSVTENKIFEVEDMEQFEGGCIPIWFTSMEERQAFRQFVESGCMKDCFEKFKKDIKTERDIKREYKYAGENPVASCSCATLTVNTRIGNEVAERKYISEFVKEQFDEAFDIRGEEK